MLITVAFNFYKIVKKKKKLHVYIYFPPVWYTIQYTWWNTQENYIYLLSNLLLVGVILMTRPGKTSSGSWIWGLLSTIKGSPHLSLMVCRVSPSPTTYISSHGRSKRLLRPFTAAPSSSSSGTRLSLIDPSRIRHKSAKAQHHDAESARFFVEEAMNVCVCVYVAMEWELRRRCVVGRKLSWSIYRERVIFECVDFS